jgi:hypothetical protein
MGGFAATNAERCLRSRVAVLFEPGRSGVAALEQASELAVRAEADLTVVVVAPQVRGGDRCGPSPTDYNAAVRDAAARELQQAVGLLERPGHPTNLALLVEGRDPPLPAWCKRHGFTTVVMPARRRILRAPDHPSSARLRRAGCRVHVVMAAQDGGPGTRQTDL